MRRPSARRPAFTLVELLVVMALIVTLAALTVGAVFRVQVAQRRGTTEATIQKLDSLLQQKLKTIQEQVNDEARLQKGGYKDLTDAGFPPDVAKAVLMYARTKYQLPISFTEAKTQFVMGGVTYNHPTLDDATHKKVLPYYATLPAASGVPAEESAVCLYIALSQLGNNGLDQQIGDAPNTPGQKCYVDSYGEPLYFNRLAFGGDGGTELDAPPFVKAGGVFDPFYPNQKPGGFGNLATDYPGNNATSFNTNVWTPFMQSFPVWAVPPALPNLKTQYPGLKNHTAAVISSGADKILGSPALYSGDNLVSYRLRKEGAKGD